MLKIYPKANSSIPLGRSGEENARQICFDISGWRELYGDGVVQLLHQRPSDADPYPVNVAVDGSTVLWTVTLADTSEAGKGKAELQYRVGDTVAKSIIWATFVGTSLGTPTDTPPEAQQGWVDKVLAAGTSAENAALRAEEAAARQPIPNADTGTWWVWNAESGAYEDTGEPYSGEGSGGTTDHNELTNRDAENQHSMSAITGLEKALAGKQPSGSYLTKETDPTVPDWAKAAEKPSYTAKEVGALSESAIYVLGEGETEADAPESAILIIDPDAETGDESTSDSDPEWQQLASIDFSLAENQIYSFEWSDLNGVTEIYLRGSKIENATTTDSGINLVINGFEVVRGFVNNKKTGSGLYDYGYARFNGLFWDSRSSTGAAAGSLITLNATNAKYPYNVVMAVGTANTIKIITGGTLTYAPVTGTLEIWVR